MRLLDQTGQAAITERSHLPLQRNHLQHVASAAALEWGQPLPPAAQPAYDLLLCSDLVYSDRSVRLLLSSIAALTAPGSVIYASCEYRQVCVVGVSLLSISDWAPEHNQQQWSPPAVRIGSWLWAGSQPLLPATAAAPVFLHADLYSCMLVCA